MLKFKNYALTHRERRASVIRTSKFTFGVATSSIGATLALCLFVGWDSLTAHIPIPVDVKPEPVEVVSQTPAEPTSEPVPLKPSVEVPAVAVAAPEPPKSDLVSMFAREINQRDNRIKELERQLSECRQIRSE